MLMHPRKGLITDPAYFSNPQDIIIQDDQFPPDFLPDYQTHCFQKQSFQSQPDVQVASPPSSAASSPSFSPTFSIPYQATAEGAPSMTPAPSYNPSLDIQSSSPASQQYYPQYYSSTPMLAQQPIASNQGWDSNLQLLSPARIYAGVQKKTSPSSNSSRSAPSSVHSHSPANGHAHRRSLSSSKPLPTPDQTPVQNNFLAAPFQNYDLSYQDGNNAEAEFAMRKAILEQQQKQQQQQQQQQPQQQRSSPQQQQNSDYSLAPSVSTLSRNSPVTPQTSLDEIDDLSKSMTNGMNSDVDRWMDDYLQFEDYNVNGNMPVGIPKLNRTISDIYQDELYNPTALMATSQMSKPAGQQNLLNPYRNVFADRLQAANQGHMSAQAQPRERSPFRASSPFAGDMSLQQSQMATSNPMTQSVSMGPTPSATTEPKTMSPKDALLDLHQEDDTTMPPLFPPTQSDFNLGDTLGLRRESSSSMRPQQNFTSMEAFPSQYTTMAPTMQQPAFNFVQPQVQRPHRNSLLQDFPSSITRFESSGSSDLHPTNELSPVKMMPEGLTRPENTSSDAGTYTCTYHGCSLRFETPAKLQRHKRDAHRQTTPGGHLISRDTASLRNSQAGPHKCERMNPSTGKPCNSVFSRPYDLTRHEDTIHNARKLKVRCHLCTEEKTFSRNDALTRHMRVVHPEIDWPGKQRRSRRD
ncbi:hypothetical protein N7474_002201 [Penicillium riverlandense]|uniref:uncharacterized protein n=1 Tax=Penicillium riverlandense TaxID=1903569 RepID=UPI00254763AC|nr:uncharacterized protein N7474_002201 [Penicillium riverlandense]KAJ5833890.1 hypothetical protein N7474_002201 [Penicillium riverlandense]